MEELNSKQEKEKTFDEKMEEGKVILEKLKESNDLLAKQNYENDEKVLQQHLGGRVPVKIERNFQQQAEFEASQHLERVGGIEPII